jgi:hypothetical protein
MLVRCFIIIQKLIAGLSDKLGEADADLMPTKITLISQQREFEEVKRMKVYREAL